MVEPSQAENAIARIAQADRALAEAVDIADAVALVQHGKILKGWAEAVNAGKDHERTAGVFVLRAMRNAGERIPEAQARGDLASIGQYSRDMNDDHISTLSDIGISGHESSEWQKLAKKYPTDASLREAMDGVERPSLAGALGRDPTPEELAQAATSGAQVEARLWMLPFYRVETGLEETLVWARNEDFSTRPTEHIAELRERLDSVQQSINELKEILA